MVFDCVQGAFGGMVRLSDCGIAFLSRGPNELRVPTVPKFDSCHESGFAEANGLCIDLVLPFNRSTFCVQLEFLGNNYLTNYSGR